MAKKLNSYDPDWEAEGRTPTLSKVKIGTTTYLLKDAAAREEIDKIAADYLVGADKAALQAAIEALGTRVTTIEGDYLKAADKTELANAIAAEAERAAGVEEGLQEQIDAIEEGLVKVKSGDKVLALDTATKELNTTLAFTYDSDNRKIKLTGIDNVLIGEVDASAFIKDGMLLGTQAFVADATSKEVTIKGQKHTFTGLVVGHQYLAFCFTDGAVPTPNYSWEIADLQNLVDVYTAGNGLALDDHEFSIKLATGSETFLTVDENGLKLAGVQTAIDNAVAAEAALREAADNDLDARLDVIEGADTVDGSIKKALKDAKAYTDAETTRATAAEAALGERIDGVDDAIEAEVTRATEAEEALDGKIDAETSRATAAEQANAAAISAEETRAEGKEAELAAAIAAEETRATGVENGLDTRLTTAEGDIDDLEDRMTAAEADIDAIEAKEDSWDAKLDNVKINGEFKEVKSDVTGKGNYVDLGSIATTDSVVANVSYEDASHTLKQQKGELTSSVHQFGDLADKNLANLEVKGQTVDVNVKSATVEVKEYAIADDAAADVAVTRGDYIPAGDVAVTLNNAAVLSSVKSAGTVATFTEGTFTPAAIQEGFVTAGSDAVLSEGAQASLTVQQTAKFANKVLKPSIDPTDDECLVFNYVDSTDTDAASAFGDAVTDRGTFTANTLQTLTGGKATVVDTSKFSGGSKAADTFNGGAMPEFNSATVGVETATFTGTKETDLKILTAQYTKQKLNDSTATKNVAISADVTTVDKAVTEKSV